MVGNTPVEIEGPAWLSDESLDIAILPLNINHKLLDSLWSHPAFTLIEYDGSLKYHRECFVIYGFPEKRAKYTRETRELNINPLRYFTAESSAEVYKKYSCCKENQLFVAYDPKKTKRFDGVSVTAPKPQGASGGPLLRALIDENNYLICFVFEGIMIRWKDGKNILSTKKVALRHILEKVLPIWLITTDFNRPVP